MEGLTFGLGDEHDFDMRFRGELVAHVWHSDLGEWTVEFSGGGVSFTARADSRAAAISLVEDGVRRAATYTNDQTEVEESGYAADDPKHPTYVERMADVWDMRGDR